MQRKAAVAYVVRTLERRWRDRLPDGRFPRPMVQVMVRSKRFQEYVELAQVQGVIAFPDRDFVPEVRRLPDDSIRDLMMEELGADPAEFICVDCGHEIQRGAKRCAPCAHWRKTARPPKR